MSEEITIIAGTDITLLEGTKFDKQKQPTFLIPHDVVVCVSGVGPFQERHAPVHEYYYDVLRGWWQGFGTIDSLRLNLRDYNGMVEVLRHGAEKYAPRNWEKGILFSRCFRAAIDHFNKGPEAFDPDSPGGMHLHRWEFFCEYAFLAAYVGRGMYEFDDRPIVVARKGNSQS